MGWSRQEARREHGQDRVADPSWPKGCPTLQNVTLSNRKPGGGAVFQDSCYSGHQPASGRRRVPCHHSFLFLFPSLTKLSLSSRVFSRLLFLFPPPRPLGKREGRQAAVWVLSSWPCCTPTAHLEATPRALFTTPLSPAAHLDITSPPRRSVFQLFKST